MSATESQAPQAAGTGPRKLEGRVALVTGGTRGIGAAIARDLAAEGAAVAVGFSSNQEKANEFLGELERDGYKASLHQGNVGDFDDCQRTIRDVIDRHGRLDILVNNAGITADRPVMKMTREDWHKVLRVNLSGAFYMSKFALDHMLERGCGRIINISSISGKNGGTTVRGETGPRRTGLAYAATKAGIDGITRWVAREGGPDGILCNAICPGAIASELTAGIDYGLEDQPIARMGNPEDIAGAVVYLASDMASFITGQTLNVDGGRLIA
jgi:acetoacetyl-CoA reductase/3-oxoacyl-[acyl-carrier protein] reductase